MVGHRQKQRKHKSQSKKERKRKWYGDKKKEPPIADRNRRQELYEMWARNELNQLPKHSKKPDIHTVLSRQSKESPLIPERKKKERETIKSDGHGGIVFRYEDES